MKASELKGLDEKNTPVSTPYRGLSVLKEPPIMAALFFNF